MNLKNQGFDTSFGFFMAARLRRKHFICSAYGISSRLTRIP